LGKGGKGGGGERRGEWSVGWGKEESLRRGGGKVREGEKSRRENEERR